MSLVPPPPHHRSCGGVWDPRGCCWHTSADSPKSPSPKTARIKACPKTSWARFWHSIQVQVQVQVTSNQDWHSLEAKISLHISVCFPFFSLTCLPSVSDNLGCLPISERCQCTLNQLPVLVIELENWIQLQFIFNPGI